MNRIRVQLGLGFRLSLLFPSLLSLSFFSVGVANNHNHTSPRPGQPSLSQSGLVSVGNRSLVCVGATQLLPAIRFPVELS